MPFQSPWPISTLEQLADYRSHNSSVTTPTKPPHMPQPTPTYQPFDTPPENDFQPGSAKIIVGPEVPPKHSPTLPQIAGVGTGLGLLDPTLPLTPQLPSHPPPPPPPVPISRSSDLDGTKHRSSSTNTLRVSDMGGGDDYPQSPAPRSAVPKFPSAQAQRVWSGVSSSSDQPHELDAISAQAPRSGDSNIDPPTSAAKLAAGLLENPGLPVKRTPPSEPEPEPTPERAKELSEEKQRRKLIMEKLDEFYPEVVAEARRDVESEIPNKTRHIVRELLTTEEDFRNDLDTVLVLYLETSTSFNIMSAADSRIIFGNWEELIEFGQVFKKPLAASACSIYYCRYKGSEVLPADWDEMDIDNKIACEILLTIGGCFLEWVSDLARVFGKYIYNQSASAKRFEQLRKEPHVQNWLDAVKEQHKDISGAWDLPAFLVKPLQRLTKYPLLLKALRDQIPSTFPDYNNLSLAIKKLDEEIGKINTRKARLDLLEKVKNGDVTVPKKLDDKKAAGLGGLAGGLKGMKLFNKDKTKAPKKKNDKQLARDLRIMARADDHTYQQLSQRFGAHFFQIQIVVADIAQYVNDVKACATWFMQLSMLLVELVGEGAQLAGNEEIVAKWIALARTAKDFSSHGIERHAFEINAKIVRPLKDLWSLHVSPHNLMMERKNHLAVYIQYLEYQEDMREDYKLVMPAELEAAKQRYEALNETLKEDLPKLYERTDVLAQVLGHAFMMHTANWHKLWVEKFAPLLELKVDGKHLNVKNILPQLDINGILMAFRNDFGPTYAEAQELSICNGALKQDITNYLSLPGPDDLDKVVSQPSTRPSTSTARPSTQTSRSETNLSSPNTSRRHSGHNSSMTSPPPTSYPTPAEQYAAAAGRMRGNSYGTTLSPSAAGPSTRPSTSSRPTSEDYRSQKKIFSSAVPMDIAGERDDDQHTDDQVMFIAASLFEFGIDPNRKEAGYPYLAYQPGEIFNVYGVKGELWLARNQDDAGGVVGWIWERHFARILDA